MDPYIYIYVHVINLMMETAEDSNHETNIKEWINVNLTEKFSCI